MSCAKNTGLFIFNIGLITDLAHGLSVKFSLKEFWAVSGQVIGMHKFLPGGFIRRLKKRREKAEKLETSYALCS